MNDERRRRSRLPWVRFEAKVKVRRSIFNSEWIAVVPFDFSHYGMGIQTDEQFDIGESVELTLQLETGVENISINVLGGVVRYKEKHHSRFNYGVEFVFSKKSEKNLLEKPLYSIEQILTHYESDENQNSIG